MANARSTQDTAAHIRSMATDGGHQAVMHVLYVDHRAQRRPPIARQAGGARTVWRMPLTRGGPSPAMSDPADRASRQPPSATDRAVTAAMASTTTPAMFQPLDQEAPPDQPGSRGSWAAMSPAARLRHGRARVTSSANGIGRAHLRLMVGRGLCRGYFCCRTSWAVRSCRGGWHEDPARRFPARWAGSPGRGRVRDLGEAVSLSRAGSPGRL